MALEVLWRFFLASSCACFCSASRSARDKLAWIRSHSSEDTTATCRDRQQETNSNIERKKSLFSICKIEFHAQSVGGVAKYLGLFTAKHCHHTIASLLGHSLTKRQTSVRTHKQLPAHLACLDVLSFATAQITFPLGACRRNEMAHLMQPQTFTRTSVLTRRAHRSLSSAVLHHFSSHCVAVAIETLSRNGNGKDQGTVVMAWEWERGIILHH